MLSPVQSSRGSRPTPSSSAGTPSASLSENWASPSELVEMRTMWSAILAQHKAEVTALRAALQRSHEQEARYQQDLRATEALRGKHEAALRIHDELARTAKAAQADSEALRLRVQQLEQVVSAASPHGGDDSNTRASAKGLEERLDAAVQENVALHETLARLQAAAAERTERLQFVQHVAAFEASGRSATIAALRAEKELAKRRHAALEDEHLLVRAESERLRSDLRAAEVQLSAARAQVDHQFEAIEREKVRHDEELRERLDAAAKRSSAAADIERSAMASEVRLLRDALEGANKALAATGEAHAAAFDESQRAVEQLTQRLAAEGLARRRAEEAAERVRREAEQQQASLADTVAALQKTQAELMAQRLTQLARADELTEALTMAVAERDAARRDADRLGTDIAALSAQLSDTRDDAAGRTAAARRAAAAEEELEAQAAFFEQQAAQHMRAMALLQERHGQDRRVLLDEIQALRRDPKKQSQRRRDTATDGSGGNDTTRHAGTDAADVKAGASQRRRSASRRGRGADKAGGVDALSTMQAVAALADRCGNILHHAHNPPPPAALFPRGW